MNEQDDNRMPADDEPDIERLLRAVGPRTEPPPEVKARAREAALDAWQALPASPRKTRLASTRWVALAATLLVSAAAAVAWLAKPADLPAGILAFATGTHQIRGNTSFDAPAIGAGSHVRTGMDGRLVVQLGPTLVVRVDGDTRFTLRSSDEIWLHAGRMFVDASGPARNSITVVTDNGVTVTDVGTEFQLHLAGDRLTAAVRDGRIDVTQGSHSYPALARDGVGEALTLQGPNLIERRDVATTDPSWGWLAETRQPFVVRGARVHQYLAWAARESGRTLRYASPLAEQQARTETLGGRGLSVEVTDSWIDETLLATSFVRQPGQAHELVIEVRR